jgi:hypothetical protein
MVVLPLVFRRTVQMPTHFSSGVSNRTTGHPLFEFPYLDPFKYYIYSNDFFTYHADEFTITTTEGGSGDIVMGLQITDTSPLATTDGIFFQKDDGDANLDFHIEKDSTQTDNTAIATLSDDTFVDVAFHYDPKGNNGSGSFRIFVDDAIVAEQTTLTNVPDNEELTVSFGIQNGAAAAKTMTLDFIMAAVER